MSIKLIGAAVCGALFTLTAQAATVDTKPAKKSTAHAITKGVAGTQSYIRAYIDPESGQWVGAAVTAQQEADASKATSVHDYSKIQTIKKADGSTEWIFNDQVMESLVATRGSDGKLQEKCVEHGVVHDDATLLETAKTSEENTNDR
jgi:hypothetical protein